MSAAVKTPPLAPAEAIELARQIREIESAPKGLQICANIAVGEKRKAEVLSAIRADLDRVNAEIGNLENKIALLEEERSELVEPYAEQIEAIDRETAEANAAASAEYKASMEKAAQLRQRLAEILGAEYEQSLVQSWTGEIPLTVRVARKIVAGDVTTAVKTVLEIAPGGKVERFLQPNDAACDLIAGLVQLKEAKPQDVREALAEYHGFGLQMTFTPVIPKLKDEPGAIVSEVTE